MPLWLARKSSCEKEGASRFGVLEIGECGGELDVGTSNYSLCICLQRLAGK